MCTWHGRSAEHTLHCWPDEFLHQLLLKVLDNHALGTNLLGLGLDCVPVLILSLPSCQHEDVRKGSCYEERAGSEIHSPSLPILRAKAFLSGKSMGPDARETACASRCSACLQAEEQMSRKGLYIPHLRGTPILSQLSSGTSTRLNVQQRCSPAQ